MKGSDEYGIANRPAGVHWSLMRDYYPYFPFRTDRRIG